MTKTSQVTLPQQLEGCLSPTIPHARCMPICSRPDRLDWLPSTSNEIVYTTLTRNGRSQAALSMYPIHNVPAPKEVVGLSGWLVSAEWTGHDHVTYFNAEVQQYLLYHTTTMTPESQTKLFHDVDMNPQNIQSYDNRSRVIS